LNNGFEELKRGGQRVQGYRMAGMVNGLLGRKSGLKSLKK